MWTTLYTLCVISIHQLALVSTMPTRACSSECSDIFKCIRTRDRSNPHVYKINGSVYGLLYYFRRVGAVKHQPRTKAAGTIATPATAPPSHRFPPKNRRHVPAQLRTSERGHRPHDSCSGLRSLSLLYTRRRTTRKRGNSCPATMPKTHRMGSAAYTA